MSLKASAANMKAIAEAKEHHDKTCVWGGKATAVHLAYFDIERLGWEEGDTIAGLVIVGDAKMQPMRMRVSCDAEPDDDDGLKEEEAVEEVVDAVSTRELTPSLN